MPDWLINLVALAGAGGIGAYAAVRADLAALKVRAEMALDAANDAHRRIDQHLNERGLP